MDAQGNIARQLLVHSYGVLVYVRLFDVRIHGVVVGRHRSCVPSPIIEVLARITAPCLADRREVITKHRFVVAAIVPFDNGLLIPLHIVRKTQTRSDGIRLIHGAQTRYVHTVERYIADDPAIMIPTNAEIQVELLCEIPAILDVRTRAMKWGIYVVPIP